MTCRECWWRRDGECHVNPPVVVPLGGSNWITVWPQVLAGDFGCSKFRHLNPPPPTPIPRPPVTGRPGY